MQTFVKKILKIKFIISLWFIFSFLFSFLSPAVLASEWRFDTELWQSTDAISDHVNADIVQQLDKWAIWTYVNSIMKILAPIIISLGLVVAFFGAYKMMSSSDTGKTKEGLQLVIFWVVWILIMVSAGFLSNALVNDVIWASMAQWWGINWILLVDKLYENIILNFMNLISYLVVGILFFLLITRVFQFLTSQDDGVRKKATWMIMRTVIGILLILAAKEVVEAVYGMQDNVLNNNAQTLSDVWTPIFETSSIPILYRIINRVMSLTTFIVLALIVFQTFQMLTKPGDPEMFKKIKKTILYVLIWVVIIGTGYLISNVLLIN